MARDCRIYRDMKFCTRKLVTLCSAGHTAQIQGHSQPLGPARVAGRGFAWWIAALDWLQEAGLRPMRRGGVVLGAGFPPPRRRVPGFLESPAAALLAPGSCCPSCSRPGDQTEHGLRHCGSGKTEPRPHPSVPLLARLPYGKGCLWLPAEKAREPGTSRQLGAPPRLGVGLGRGPGDRRSWGVFLPGLWWGAVG